MDNNIINNIISKSRMKIAVSKFEVEDIKMPRRSLLKLVATFVLVTIVTGGLVYATGNAIYEKIWKQPETYEFSYEITENEKKDAISEEEARKKASEYLSKIGLDNEVTGLGLTKDFLRNEVIWNIGFGSGTITMDREGNFKRLNIPSYNYKIPYNYGITREEARNTAKELLSKYNPNNNDYEYELISLKGNMEEDKACYIWYATFYKKYGDLINQYEKIDIGWIPTINGLYSLNIENYVYENNEQVISKEDAIKIATKKDKQIETRHSIELVEAEIGIDKMNTEVIYREKDIEEYEKGIINFLPDENGKIQKKDDAVFYKVDNRVRKVWEVTIYYDYYKYKENGAERYVYYVDATTGEIIGGNKWSGSQKQIAQLMDDPYNLIEK